MESRTYFLAPLNNVTKGIYLAVVCQTGTFGRLTSSDRLLNQVHQEEKKFHLSSEESSVILILFQQCWLLPFQA